MPACSLPECKSNSQKGFKLYKVPKSKEESEKWLNFMHENKLEKISENSCLCELHFLWFQTDNGLTRALVPTIAPYIEENQVRVKIN